MKHTITAVLFLTSLGLSEISYAYTSYGSGTDSCGTWVEDRKTTSGWYQSGQWVNGFISAAGYYGINFKESDVNALLVFMDNYCKNNPLDKVSDGAKALAKALELK